MNKISIIIPVLNEAENIRNLLDHLLKNSSEKNIADILFIDGGSFDTTQEIVSNLNNAKLLCSKKGRAVQMNLGAKNAKGNVLYFLHVDSYPPEKFDKHILKEVARANNAGCFRMTFNSKHWWLKLAGQLTRLPWKSCRGGDQSLFITKSLFNKIGGYDETFKIYEDNDLISRLYAINQFVIIPKWLTTSARRYHNTGVFRLQYHFWTIHLKKWFGASAEDLNQYYLKYVSVKN